MSRTFDFIILYRFLKLFNMKWTSWDAFKLGIIDRKGAQIKTAETRDEKEAWTPLIRMVWRIKKLIQKLGGGSQLTTIVTSLLLIKSSYNVGDEEFMKMLNDCKFPNYAKPLIVLEVAQELGISGYIHEGITFMKLRPEQQFNPAEASRFENLLNSVASKIQNESLDTMQHYLFNSKSNKRSIALYLTRDKNARIIRVSQNMRPASPEHEAMLEEYEGIEFKYVEIE